LLYDQIPETFTVGKLTEHQGKQLVPTGEVLHIFVAIILGYDAIELTAVEKPDQLGENIFILKHRLSDSSEHKAMFSSPFGLKTSVTNYISNISKNNFGF
jgi:hypothetical protein